MLNEGNKIHYFILYVCVNFCDTMKQSQHYLQMANIHIQFQIIHAVLQLSVVEPKPRNVLMCGTGTGSKSRNRNRNKTSIKRSRPATKIPVPSGTGTNSMDEQ
jgi:hypothetical protein